MLIKLECGCIALIVEQVHEGDILVRVVARTIEHCNRDEEDFHFGILITYDRMYNIMEKLPPNHDTWDKIQKGCLLTDAEQEPVYQRLNELLMRGYRFEELKRLLA